MQVIAMPQPTQRGSKKLCQAIKRTYYKRTNILMPPTFQLWCLVICRGSEGNAMQYFLLHLVFFYIFIKSMQRKMANFHIKSVRSVAGRGVMVGRENKQV